MRALLTVAGGYGHLYPLVPLATALAEAGHDVAVAVPEYFAHAVAEVGLEPVPLAAAGVSAQSEGYKTKQAGRVPITRGRAALERYLTQAVLQTPALCTAATRWGADLLVRETTAYAAWLAGEQLGLPVAVADFVATPVRVLATLSGDLFARARSGAGLTPDPRLDSLHRWAHLLAGPPGWFPPAAFGPSTRLFQPPAEPRSEPWSGPPPAEAGTDRPFVYVTMGTLFHRTPGLFGMLFEALAGLPVDVLATVGPDTDPRSFGPLPPRIRVEGFVPQAHVLARADAVVCHGGYGSLMGALRHGVPVVCLPLAAADNAGNAARVEALGAGIALSEQDRSADAVRGALRTVLREPGYAEAAARVATAIRTLPPLSDAVPLLDTIVSGCRG